MSIVKSYCAGMVLDTLFLFVLPSLLDRNDKRIALSSSASGSIFKFSIDSGLFRIGTFLFSVNPGGRQSATDNLNN